MSCRRVVETILRLPGAPRDSRASAWPETSPGPQPKWSSMNCQKPEGQGVTVSMLRVGSTLLRENIWLDLKAAKFFYLKINTLFCVMGYKPECTLTLLVRLRKLKKYTRTMYLIRTLTKRCLPQCASIPMPRLWWQKAFFFNAAETSERAKFSFWLSVLFSPVTEEYSLSEWLSDSSWIHFFCLGTWTFFPANTQDTCFIF